MAAISSKAILKTTDPYKYNAGSELEEELNYYNTFYRKYDAQIGRFTGVDILAESTAGLSPFQFGNNNPVMFNDPTGAKSARTIGRMEKGPDDNYHTGWVNENLWNNLGFFDFENPQADDGGGGGGGNYQSFSGIFSQAVLDKMRFGDKVIKNKLGEYGFWSNYSFSTTDRGYVNAGSTKESLAEVSIGGARKWVALSSDVKNYLYGGYNWQKTGTGWTTQIHNLGWTAIEKNSSMPRVTLLNDFIPIVCIQVPSRINDESKRNRLVNIAWNEAIDIFLSELNSPYYNIIKYDDIAARKKFRDLFTYQINLTVGSSITIGSCLQINPFSYPKWSPVKEY